jgi:hypothetical protein
MALAIIRGSEALPASFGAQQPEHPQARLQVRPGHRHGPAGPPGQAGDLDIHDASRKGWTQRCT